MDAQDPTAQEPVTLIDAHHHVWTLNQNHYPWLSDHPEPHFFLGNYDAIKRNYLPEDYRRDSAAHRVIATVHCEAEWTRDDQVGETAWLTQVHEQHGLPTAIVAHAWFHTPNSQEVLARQAQFKLVRGIQTRDSPAARSDGARLSRQHAGSALAGRLRTPAGPRPQLGFAGAFLASA